MLLVFAEKRSEESLKNTIKVAFCGVMAALSTVVMFLTGVFPTVTIAFPAVAGCLLVPVVAEFGRVWGLGTYLVCCVLSFLLAPDREAALIYTLFFGYYPVLLPVLEQIGNRVLKWAAKILLFNAMCLAETALSIYVLGIPWENIGILGKATPVVLLVLANAVFLLYDRALKGLIAVYFQKLHSRVSRALRGK